MNVTLSSTLTQIFFFCKEENEVLRTFIHLESCDKNVHLYDSTMWCVRVCICYVGWQNTSYTVDTACTPSLSGLATATNRCTLCTSTKGVPTGADQLPLFSSRPVEPSKRSRPSVEFP